MKRMTAEEAKEWRRRSVERYQGARRKPARRAESPQAQRKTADDAYYRQQREMRLVRAGGRCEYDGPYAYPFPSGPEMRCQSAATQAHHVVRRSNHLDHSVENLRALCLEHHQMVHLNVEWAKSTGWIKTDWPQIGGQGATAADG